jgi:hypothetical protein
MGTNGGTAADCYSTASVSGANDVGGLVGLNGDTITDCYSAGSVSGSGDDFGGLVGRNTGQVWYSFWDIETGGPDNGIGIPLPTEQLQTMSTFTDAGWDFVSETVNGLNNIWTINDGIRYPEHVWPLVNLTGWYEVDLLDYAFFANQWGQDNCPDVNDCDGADFDFSSDVNWADLKIFCDHWLEGTRN